MSVFSDRLNEILKQKSMKQADLMRLTGLSKSMINNYVRGFVTPKQKNLLLIVDSLEMNIAEFWWGNGNAPFSVDDSAEKILKWIYCGEELDRREFTEIFIENNKQWLICATKEERRLIQLFSLLDEKGKHTVQTILEVESMRCLSEEKETLTQSDIDE